MNAQATGINLAMPEHLISLASSAFTMTIDISCWTAQKSDRELAQKISADGNATETVGKWAHDLFVRDRELKAVHNHRQAVHNWLVSPATSFDWRGKERIFPGFRAETALAKVVELQEEFFKKRDIFLDGDAAAGIPDYDAKIAAQAFVRGDMFRRSDYPSKEAVRRKFRFDWYVGKVREDDFRNLIALDAAQDVAKHMERQHLRLLDQIAETQREQLAGLLKSLSHSCAMEEAEDGALSFRRLHSSTVEKTIELCETFAQFNPTGDTVLAEAVADLRGVFSRFDLDHLRSSETAREKVKTTADDLLSKLAF